MYNKKFIDFLKKHNIYNEELLNYLNENMIRYDYSNIDLRAHMGSYFMYKYGYLIKIKQVLPYMDSDITILINIREYVQALIAFPHLNKKHKFDDTKRVLPIFYENLYVIESNNQKLMEYEKYLDSFINEDSPIEYKIAKEIVPILLEIYTNKELPLNELNKNVKKLSKKI